MAIYTRDELREIADRAEGAFWASVVEQVPQATTGDLDPAASEIFSASCRSALESWLNFNLSGTVIQRDPACGHDECVAFWRRHSCGGEPWCQMCPVCHRYECDCGFSPEELYELLREEWGDAVLLEHTGGGCMNATIYIRGDSRSDSAAYVMFTIGWYPEECGFGLFSLTGDGAGWEEPVRQWSPDSIEEVPLYAQGIRDLVRNTVSEWLAPLEENDDDEEE